MLRDSFDPPPNHAFIFIFKYFLLCNASHIGWFGLFSVMVTTLIQLHYAFSMIIKGLGLAIELSREQTLYHKKKKMVIYSYKSYKSQVRVTREVLYVVKVLRIMLRITDEAFYIIIPFMFLFGEIIFISCCYATIKMYDYIPMPFFLTLSCGAIFAFIFMQILFPFA